MSSGSSSVSKNVRVNRAPEGMSTRDFALADTVDISNVPNANPNANERANASVPPTKKGSTPPGAAPTRGRRALRFIKRWSIRLAIAGAVLTIGALITGYLLVRHYEEGLPSVAELERGYRPSQVTRVTARDGTTIAELFTERRTIIHTEDLPRFVINAFVAAEDASFYEHEGINYFGIARAAVVNLRSGRTRQGGSTITQQVVKNILLESNERTYRRKMREALLARRLEQELCPECGNDRAGRDKRKDKIIELYLNHIYLGHGRYGLEETAKDTFGHSAKQLTIAEAAMLAGVPAAPEAYNPKRDLNKALVRRAFVLDQMHQKHFITDAEYEAAKVEPVRLAANQEIDSELAPEAVQIAKKLLLELEPERGPHGGFTISTTIDPTLQAAARKALRDNINAYDKRHQLLAPIKAPAIANNGKKKTAVKDVPPFEGTPKFESHKVFNGVVIGADDAAGTIDVRVGTIVGTVKIAEYKRYNPENLPASKFAEVGARLRVSLLAPIPNAAAQVTPPNEHVPVAKVPLRLELGPESAIVMVDVRTRNILAIAGNYEAANGGLDRVTQSHRQPGSTFKPVVYSYAIHARRYTPATLVDVQPTMFNGGYKPANYEGWTGADPLRLREALANSVNVAAVHVIEDVGPANVVDWAKALGIESTLKPDLSLALGSYEVKPIELVGAYATFASGGMYEEPRLVTRIVGPDGKEVPLKPPAPARRVLDPAEAYVVTSMLQSVVDHGTAQKAKSLARPVAGKTGTSNEAKDTWFAGFSPEIATVVWVGYDDNKPLGSGETGGSTALPAWINVMKVAHEGKPRSEFPRPPGITTVAIDPKTGKLKAEGSEDSLDEVFLSGTEPTEAAEPSSAPSTSDASSSTTTTTSALSGDAGEP